jgi:hypothetical protein
MNLIFLQNVIQIIYGQNPVTIAIKIFDQLANNFHRKLSQEFNGFLDFGLNAERGVDQVPDVIFLLVV